MNTMVEPELAEPFQRIADRQQAVLETESLAAPGLDTTQGRFPEPEDRGLAVLSELGDVEYVEDLIRPGRIHLWAAEEGSGKSYAVDDELGIRVAVAGGDFAGTWPVRRKGPVLYLSEMHPDDDFEREQTTLASLDLERGALTGKLFRLSLMTAAGGVPALTDPSWRSSITDWLRYRGALLLIVDTATGATQVEPWGKDIQAVYGGLHKMLESYPALAIVLVVHLKKPQGRGARRLSDVLGEWGRWADIVILQENDGHSLERTRITVRKRVRRERRILATKRGGLLVEPSDADGGPVRKVSSEQVLNAITSQPGLTYLELAGVLEVSKDTATRYVKDLGGLAELLPVGPKGAIRVYSTAAPPHTAAHAAAVVVGAAERTSDRRTAARTCIGAAVRAAVVDGGAGPGRGTNAAVNAPSWNEDLAERATDDDAEGLLKTVPAPARRDGGGARGSGDRVVRDERDELGAIARDRSILADPDAPSWKVDAARAHLRQLGVPEDPQVGAEGSRP